MGLPVSALARRRTHAGTAKAPLRAELGSKTPGAQARARFDWRVGHPAAFQHARYGVPAPLSMQGSSVMKRGSGHGGTHAIPCAPGFVMLDGARRATADCTQIQLVHDSPR